MKRGVTFAGAVADGENALDVGVTGQTDGLEGQEDRRFDEITILQ